jgi:hypothetical protein
LIAFNDGDFQKRPEQKEKENWLSFWPFNKKNLVLFSESFSALCLLHGRYSCHAKHHIIMITEEKTKISPRKRKQFHLDVMKDQQGYHQKNETIIFIREKMTKLPTQKNESIMSKSSLVFLLERIGALFQLGQEWPPAQYVYM